MTTNRTTLLTWLITGASSGIGRALAAAAAERGDRVVALARTLEPLRRLADEHDPHVLPLAVDVRRPEEVDAAVQRGLREFGRLDVVANNAGYGLFGAVEEASDEQARAVFDTNLFGALNVLRATLPVLRAQRSGHVLQGSSCYGQSAHPGVGLLAATKHALEGLSDALAEEVAPLGIRVTLVEPGLTATPFLSNLDVAEAIADYDPTVRHVQQEIGRLPASAFDSAEDVAAAVLEAVDADRPPRRLATGRAGASAMRAALTARLDELDAWAPVGEVVDAA
ncbi:short-subunit dehydrogenase [Kineococcus xinjiangensis]|uniref:Short-subunit dehydrogenase n=1 Tax=Kineococcus xinjiangensis TaxID=512762 RepID=A0A2S6IG89_9ACTN|nr:SDR family NAD(P)-dependent oxidoreductase [Kineococcus xinjiangensis]PPK93170.1 short-subunit dehydrogenase [Kineococcus xinjiangensis]